MSVKDQIGLNVELKGIEYSEGLSEDSNCFFASVYVDGKKEGTARDNGMGGMIVIEPKQLLDKLTDAGLKMGKVKVDFTGELFDIDAEDIINQLLTEYLYKKDFKRVIKKSKVQYVVEGEIYELKVKPTSDKMRAEQVSIVK